MWAGNPAWTPPANNGAVAQWDDGSGNGRHMAQGTAANRPLYRAASAALNNQPAVEAVDTTDSLAQTAYTAISHPVSVVWVGRVSASTPTAFFHDGISAAARCVVTWADTNLWTVNAGSAVTHGTGDTATHLFEWVLNGSSSKLFIDGAQVGSTSSHGANAPVGFTLFNRYSSDTSGGTRTLGMWGVYAGNWENEAQRSAFHTWVASHYGLTIDPF